MSTYGKKQGSRCVCKSERAKSLWRIIISKMISFKLQFEEAECRGQRARGKGNPQGLGRVFLSIIVEDFNNDKLFLKG